MSRPAGASQRRGPEASGSPSVQKKVASLDGEYHSSGSPCVAHPTRQQGTLKFVAPLGFESVSLRAEVRVEAQGLVHCADQTLGDCVNRRVGEKGSLERCRSQVWKNTCASSQVEADAKPGIQACRGQKSNGEVASS